MAWSLETLVRSPWLSRQPATVAEALLAVGHVHRIEAGQEVFGAGEAGLFALVEGRLAITAEGAAGKPVLIDILQSGAWFAQVPARGQGPSPLVLCARSQALLFVVPEALLHRVGRARAELLHATTDLLAQQHHDAARMITRLLTATPARLIALRLVALAEGDPPFAAVSQSELGALTGMTRKAINAHLGVLEADGLVRRAYGRVDLVDLASLRKIA